MANGINWIGIDDSADKWTIAQYVDGAATPAREFELVPSESGYRKLIGWLRQLGGEVRVVYEAGPCGYELYRKLRQKRINCEVAAPSLTPRRPGERVKTNRRVDIARKCDARLNRRFHRLTSRGKPSNVAVVAVARELVGFIWAIGQQLEFQKPTKSNS